MDAEHKRLEAARQGTAWSKWGPYLSERQWGTVREDYSHNGDAWNAFTHDQSRSRAYRWGEDGIAGVSDDGQHLCFALALWNGRDPILKERLFGLTNNEGNHGEDCKEYYFYLDNTPTHSYMKYLYKYPQSAYPYLDLIQTNRARSRREFEYELLDTGVFNEDRYFDVFVEYAKESPEDLLIRITIWNRGPEQADLHVLPTLWFRNTWSWGLDPTRPAIARGPLAHDLNVVTAEHVVLGERYLYCAGNMRFLFTENETNTERLSGLPNVGRYVKDGIGRFLVDNEAEAVNPDGKGTKVAADYTVAVVAGGSTVIHLRLTTVAPAALKRSYPNGNPFGEHFDKVFRTRVSEANEFYDSALPQLLNEDERMVCRQALSGMLWSKQHYTYDVGIWLSEHGLTSVDRTVTVRNREWVHMYNSDIISMPDKWEYPWYAAWDLAFHTLPLAIVDPDFANDQLSLMMRERYLHPNGQIPAYEWNFSDVNPPVHAWACIFNHRLRKEIHGHVSYEFLKQAFQRLLVNFTWWVNRKDLTGTNVFGGGFLGLDNIGVFHRSQPLPTGGYLEQADGTAWMALFSQNMLEIALELSTVDLAYEEMANRFLEHFLWIASAINRSDKGMWDEEDGFFYDLLRTPDGRAERLKVRSLVGLLPLCASTVYEGNLAERVPRFTERARWFGKRHLELLADIHSPAQLGVHGRHLLATVKEERMRRLLAIMLDENEFLSDYGIRSISRYHKDHPYIFRAGGQEFRVDYEPAESSTGAFGGNSNWRGPIWLPTNIIIVRALLQYYRYYGDSFRIECPTGSGNQMNLFEVAREICARISRIYLRDNSGRRAVYGGITKFQEDPHWRDCLLFHEYFHGDDGAGLGASHQTGWSGLVASVIHLLRSIDPASFLHDSPLAAIVPARRGRPASSGR